jgi:hypothetical protein
MSYPNVHYAYDPTDGKLLTGITDLRVYLDELALTPIDTSYADSSYLSEEQAYNYYLNAKKTFIGYIKRDSSTFVQAKLFLAEDILNAGSGASQEVEQIKATASGRYVQINSLNRSLAIESDNNTHSIVLSPVATVNRRYAPIFISQVNNQNGFRLSVDSGKINNQSQITILPHQSLVISYSGNYNAELNFKALILSETGGIIQPNSENEMGSLRINGSLLLQGATIDLGSANLVNHPFALAGHDHPNIQVAADNVIQPVQITSFTLSQTIAEDGTFVPNLDLNWSTNRPIDYGELKINSVTQILTVFELSSQNKNISTINQDTTFQLILRETTNPNTIKLDSETRTITFVNPYYYGPGADNLDATGIQSLTKLVQAKSNKSLSYNANQQKLYLVYPLSYGALSSFKNPSGLELISSLIQRTVMIAGVTCLVYETNQLLTVNGIYQASY